MPLEIPEKISAEEWRKLPETQQPIFRQSGDDPNYYEYAVPQFHNSMKNAKAERDEYRSQVDSLKAEIGVYKQFGSPDDLSDLKQREELIKNQTATLEDQIRQANEDARKREADNVKRMQAERDSAYSSMLDYAKRNRVELMIENSGIDPDYRSEAINAAMSAIQTEMRDGQPVFTVMENGQIARDPDTHDPMTPERWFHAYRQKKGKLFKGETQAKGPGFTPGQGNLSGALQDKDPTTWTMQEKMEFQRQNGANFSTAYAALHKAWAAKRLAEKKSA
ncbi:MAG: hypothetical protein AAGC77_13255 [Pseudomonadota bacterium]